MYVFHDISNRRAGYPDKLYTSTVLMCSNEYGFYSFCCLIDFYMHFNRFNAQYSNSTIVSLAFKKAVVSAAVVQTSVLF